MVFWWEKESNESFICTLARLWLDGQTLATPSLPGWPTLRRSLVVHGVGLTREVLTASH